MKQIPLTRGKVALVDDDDFEYINKYKWCVYICNGMPYAKRGKNKKTELMHRVIMNPPSDMQIDHINGNGLDNRRINLRIVTSRQNQQNRHQIKSSNYPGVYWNKNKQKWHATIKIKGAHKHILYTENECEAATAYNVASNYLCK